MYSRPLLMFFMVTLLFISGCTTAHNPAGMPMPQMTFEHLERIPINVGALKSHTDKTDFRAESFVASPYEAIENYLRSRFAPAGAQGTLEVMIEDASIQHSYQPSTNKVGAYLEVAGSDVYDMVVKVRLQHLDETGQVVYSTVLTGKRLIKVNEHASITEREKRQYEALESLFNDLDREILRIVLKDMNLGSIPAPFPPATASTNAVRTERGW